MSIEKLNQVLDAFGVDATCVNHQIHRHIATYDIELAPGTRVASLEKYGREIALAIKSKTTPIFKVVTELGIVRMQVAMNVSETLLLEDILNGNAPVDIQLPILLGEDDTGNKLWTDFAKHPHTLVAGGTGSGKSTLLHALIANAYWLTATGQRNVRVFLGDPKRVEFSVYDGAPKMNGIIRTIKYDYESILSMLNMLHTIMEHRYAMLAEHHVQDISKLDVPIYLVIIDEVADLMMQDKGKQFEKLVTKLAQKSRAAGIHLVMATQRPSTDVITGLIKANFPARIACRVASRTDSQVILDSPGAENLLGKGDALLQNHETDKLRFQAAFFSPEGFRQKAA